MRAARCTIERLLLRVVCISPLTIGAVPGHQVGAATVAPAYSSAGPLIRVDGGATVRSFPSTVSGWTFTRADAAGFVTKYRLPVTNCALWASDQIRVRATGQATGRATRVLVALGFPAYGGCALFEQMDRHRDWYPATGGATATGGRGR